MSCLMQLGFVVVCDIIILLLYILLINVIWNTLIEFSLINYLFPKQRWIAGVMNKKKKHRTDDRNTYIQRNRFHLLPKLEKNYHRDHILINLRASENVFIWIYDFWLVFQWMILKYSYWGAGNPLLINAQMNESTFTVCRNSVCFESYDFVNFVMLSPNFCWSSSAAWYYARSLPRFLSISYWASFLKFCVYFPNYIS